MGKCGVNSHYLPPTLLGKRENIFLYDYAYIDYRSVLFITGGKLVIKENSIVAEGLTAITGQHQSKIGEVFGKAGNSNLLEKDIIVEEDVWIGAGVMLLSGAHIGRGAIIGAGAVVRDQNIPPYSIVVGNPAKIIGFRFTVEETLEHEKLHKRKANHAETDHRNAGTLQQQPQLTQSKEASAHFSSSPLWAYAIYCITFRSWVQALVQALQPMQL